MYIQHPDLEPYNPPLNSPATATPTIFDPPEDRIPQILEHLDSPMASLYMVAQANDTTLEALSLWLARPDIRARNAQIDSAAAARNRSLATRNLRRAVAVLAQTLERCAEEDRDQPFSHDPKSILARTRNRNLARKSGHQLLQIARFDPSLPVPLPPGGRAGEGLASNLKRTSSTSRNAHHNRIVKFLTQPAEPQSQQRSLSRTGRRTSTVATPASPFQTSAVGSPTLDRQAIAATSNAPSSRRIYDRRRTIPASPRTLLASAGQPPPPAIQPPPPKLSPYVNYHEGRDPALVPDRHSHDP